MLSKLTKENKLLSRITINYFPIINCQKVFASLVITFCPCPKSTWEAKFYLGVYMVKLNLE